MSKDIQIKMLKELVKKLVEENAEKKRRFYYRQYRENREAMKQAEDGSFKDFKERDSYRQVLFKSLLVQRVIGMDGYVLISNTKPSKCTPLSIRFSKEELEDLSNWSRL